MANPILLRLDAHRRSTVTHRVWVPSDSAFRLERMDKVRLGRILGAGARQAARTAVQALDAAMAPDPNPPRKPSPPAPNAAFTPPATHTPAKAGITKQEVANAAAKALHTARAIDDGKRRMKQATLAPIKKASRTLWFEMTGSFFLIFALPFAYNAVRVRSGIHIADPNHTRFLTYIALAILFGYFGISSFLRARKVG